MFMVLALLLVWNLYKRIAGELIIICKEIKAEF
jgi:hypothetical protein